MRRFVWGLLFASPTFAAEYCAGVARLEVAPGAHVSALAIGRGTTGRVVVVEAEGELTRSVVDSATARSQLERAQIVFLPGEARSGAGPVKLVDGLVTSIGAALGDCRPAALSFTEEGGAATLRVDGPVKATLAVTGAGKASLHLGTTPAAAGRIVRGPIRTAFRMIERPPELRTREHGAAPEETTYVQAIRFGRELTLAAVGEAPSGDLAAQVRRGLHLGREPLVVIACGAAALPSDLHEGLAPVLRIVLRRVGRRP